MTLHLMIYGKISEHEHARWQSFDGKWITACDTLVLKVDDKFFTMDIAMQFTLK